MYINENFRDRCGWVKPVNLILEWIGQNNLIWIVQVRGFGLIDSWYTI